MSAQQAILTCAFLRYGDDENSLIPVGSRIGVTPVPQWEEMGFYMITEVYSNTPLAAMGAHLSRDMIRLLGPLEQLAEVDT